jgi:hypothetical protein
MYMLPDLAELPQSLRLVHVGIAPDFHLLPHHLPSFGLSVHLDDWL